MSTDNIAIIVIGIIAAIIVIYNVYVFIKMPSDKQLEKVKEWMLYAVTEAEKSFDSGTGVIKLRYVYDMFIAKFPAIATVITFENFSLMVDEALAQMKALIESNKAIQEYINK